MKTGVEMKGMLSPSHAGDRDEHYNHYHPLVGAGCACCRLQGDRLELGGEEWDNTACILLNMDVCISVYFIFNLLTQ